jgi:hypothetical protein
MVLNIIIVAPESSQNRLVSYVLHE